MFKKILIIFALFAVNIVYAGSYEDALQKKGKVFLYFYSPQCRTCKNFDTIFNSLKKQIPDYEFVRVNAETPYGMHLFLSFKGRYVPLIILTDAKTKKSVNINHTCVMDEVCLARAMKSFKG